MGTMTEVAPEDRLFTAECAGCGLQASYHTRTIRAVDHAAEIGWKRGTMDLWWCPRCADPAAPSGAAERGG